MADKKGATGKKKGNPERALKKADKVIKAVYEVPYHCLLYTSDAADE